MLCPCQFAESFDFSFENPQFTLNINQQGTADAAVEQQPNMINLQLEEESIQKQQQAPVAPPTFLSDLNIGDRVEQFPSNKSLSIKINSNEKKIPGLPTQPFTAFRSILTQTEISQTAPAGIFEQIRKSLIKGEKFTANNFTPRPIPIPVTETRTTSTSSTTEETTSMHTTVATTEMSPVPNRIIISSIIPEEDFKNLETDEISEIKKDQIIPSINMKKKDRDGSVEKNQKLNNIIDLISSLTQPSLATEVPSAKKVLETQEKIFQTTKNEEDFLDLIVNNAEDSNQKKLSLDIEDDIIGISDVVRKIKKAQNEDIKDEEASQEHGDYSAVEEALTTLLRSDPRRKHRVGPVFVKTAVRLDEFLQKEEEEKRQTVDKINRLLEEAIGLASGVVDLRENVKERLMRQKPKDIPLEEGLKSSQLYKVLRLLE